MDYEFLLLPVTTGECECMAFHGIAHVGRMQWAWGGHVCALQFVVFPRSLRPDEWERGGGGMHLLGGELCAGRDGWHVRMGDGHGACSMVRMHIPPCTCHRRVACGGFE